ncbi:MAG: hypothetical protein HYY51_00010 [Candidatus Magasanikbacteria bacterium]|nr:hypothetical protein [Candidatus Magasanikbacteria bacterium]
MSFHNGELMRDKLARDPTAVPILIVIGDEPAPKKVRASRSRRSLQKGTPSACPHSRISGGLCVDCGEEVDSVG